MRKVLLITGTSSGLGAGIGVAAAKAGLTVYATMRDVTKRGALEELANKENASVRILPLDIQDANSVDAAVARVIAEEGRIDVLVNNAGMGFVRATEQTTLDEIARVIDVNFMGVVRTTKAVLPHMRDRKSGHIINISSVGGLVGQPFNEVYCASKFAVEGYTEALASYVQPNFNIKFSLIEPGGILSEFANSAMRQVAATGGMLQDKYLPIIEKYMGRARERGATAFQTVEQVTASVMACIAMENPPLRMRSSAWAEDFVSLKTGLDPDGTKQRDRVIKTFLG